MGEATTFPLIIFFVRGHGANSQMSFCLGTPNLGVSKFLKLGFPQLCGPIMSCADLWLRSDLKQSYNPCQDLSHDMWNTTCTWVNRGDFSLMIGSQIGSLTPGPSFGHNLCFKYPKGSCEPILNIYIPRYFQWYEELFNPISFGPWNCPMKIWDSIKTLTPKVGAHLGVWGFIPSHFPTILGAWNVTPRLHSWLAPLQALVLVVSPKLGLRHPFTPKAMRAREHAPTPCPSTVFTLWDS
jgi:hypothetical protein